MPKSTPSRSARVSAAKFGYSAILPRPSAPRFIRGADEHICEGAPRQWY
jgi:hypothetical protein